jgi:hypothetical protein
MNAHYTHSLIAAAAAALALAAAHMQRVHGPRPAWARCAEWAVLVVFGAWLGGRIAYAALYGGFAWAHVFDGAAGGSAWSGAALGAIAFGACAARLLFGAGWRATWPHVLCVFAVALPIVAAGATIGCAGLANAGCGYGVSLATLADWPPLLAAELPDIYGLAGPRANIPLFLALAAVLTGGVVGSGWRRPDGGFWPALAFWAAAMALIGLLRADAALPIAGMRAPVVADTAVAVFAVWRAVRVAGVMAADRQMRRRGVLPSAEEETVYVDRA